MVKDTVGATLGGLLTLNPFGANHGTLVADLFGLDAAELSMSSNDTVIVSFLMALVIIPIIAFVANASNIRDSSSSSTAGMSEINLD